jgi:DNA-binding NarL/FixJ family response regulator
MVSLGGVALFGSNTDAMLQLSKLLESAGFDVVSALIPDVCDGRCDIVSLMDGHDPAVVVYDIGMPYDQAWRLFEKLRAQPAVRDRQFILTTMNAARVEALAGGDRRIYEIVNTDSDPGEIVHAIKEAARARVVRAEQPHTNVTVMSERRVQTDRRHGWTSNEVYAKLREKREAVEVERRRGFRRADDNDPNHSHAA